VNDLWKGSKKLKWQQFGCHFSLWCELQGTGCRLFFRFFQFIEAVAANGFVNIFFTEFYKFVAGGETM
jgi:hypothetical protein